MQLAKPILSVLIACAGALALLAQQPTLPTPPAPSQAQPSLQAPAQALSVVVLDPAHGGSDLGARGAGGILEKEMVLDLARAVQTQLERQGLRVVLTRQADENPSFDDRAAAANAQRGAVLISLHVSSTGPAGTARAYFAAAENLGKQAAEAPGFLRWQEAQQPYAAHSRRLAEILQVQLGQKLRGSPETPVAGAVRQLRSITAPAVAIELSSVSVPDRSQLDKAIAPLAEAVGRAVAAFKVVYEAGGK